MVLQKYNFYEILNIVFIILRSFLQIDKCVVTFQKHRNPLLSKHICLTY